MRRALASAVPIRRLDVRRHRADGTVTPLGTLARDARGHWFEYDGDYLHEGHSLSPFRLRFAAGPQPAAVGEGARRDALHGVFADALPDGWGRLLMDSAFRRAGLSPHEIGALDRLAFLGDRTTGALSFAPALESAADDAADRIDLAVLGDEATRVFDGDVDEVLAELLRSGGSGGARPKAQLWRDADGGWSTRERDASEACLVKFTSASLPLGHEEGVCEAAWLTMAREAGVDVARFDVVERATRAGTRHWLSLARFDRVGGGGRHHLVSASGLLDADHRLPSLDHEDLVRLSATLCRSTAAARETVRRAIFGLLAVNQDDHAKNYAWLMDDEGRWSPSPAYDLTFSPSPSGEHMTSYGGFGRAPPAKAIVSLGELAGLDRRGIGRVVDEVATALDRWPTLAADFGIRRSTVREIGERLERARRENRELFARG